LKIREQVEQRLRRLSGPRLSLFAPLQIFYSVVLSSLVKAVKVISIKNCPRKSLMLNAVKPGQTKSNHFDWRVKVTGNSAKFAGLKPDTSWQQVNFAGGLSEFRFSRCQQVPDIVSYCHIGSPIRR
jgi:hypothetical protein